MINAREFTEQIAQQCEPLFQLCENNVKMYWANNPSKEEAIEYFGRRMINERINCIELSQKVSKMSMATNPEEMFLLSKQAHDEAKHFWFVKDILEDLMGEPVDIDVVYQDIKGAQLRGERGFMPAELLSKFECSEDPMALAVYQYIAEGMAHRNWVAQSECAPNDLIREKYAEIAKDEKFHSQIGRMQIEKLVVDEESLSYSKKLSEEVIELLWGVSRFDKERCIKAHIPLSALN
jgi:rubrerythrin